MDKKAAPSALVKDDPVLESLVEKKSGRRDLPAATDATIRAALQRAAGELDGRLERRLANAELTIDGTLTQVEDLPDLAEELAGKSAVEAQAQFATESADWYQAMSDIEYLEILARQGRLSDPTAVRYERLKEAIAQQLPLIERLELYVPEIPLESRAARTG